MPPLAPHKRRSSQRTTVQPNLILIVQMTKKAMTARWETAASNLYLQGAIEGAIDAKKQKGEEEEIDIEMQSDQEDVILR